VHLDPYQFTADDEVNHLTSTAVHCICREAVYQINEGRPLK